MKWFDRFLDVVGFSGLRRFDERPHAVWPMSLIDQPKEPVSSWDSSDHPGPCPAIDREQLAEVRSAIASVLDWLDRLDPTPLGLAQAAANVTDINTHRK